MYVADMVTTAQAKLCGFSNVRTTAWQLRNSLVFKGN
jgi:hypothetical protein